VSKFGSKSPVKMLMSLSLNLRREERTVTVVKLTEGLRPTEAGVNVFEDVGWKEWRAASTGQGIVRMCAGWEVICRRRRGLCRPDFRA